MLIKLGVMKMLDFLGHDPFFLNKVNNALYFVDTECRFCFGDIGFSSLISLKEQIGFNNFWDDKEKNDKVLADGEKLFYTKVIDTALFLLKKRPSIYERKKYYRDNDFDYLVFSGKL
ncbi:MAG: hypothetical protein LRY69_06585 [Gammaproteobacteria bacterium]|nr:hypothetical protein [Gammaproteobacteria bacterium]